MLDAADAMPAASSAAVRTGHEVIGTPLRPPFPEGYQTAIFGMGCFWGASRAHFWQGARRLHHRAVGYGGRTTPTRPT